MIDFISHLVSGATAGISLGPVGAAVGAILGVAPDALNALGIHLFDEPTATAAMSFVKTLTGNPSPTAADVAGLSEDQRVQLQVNLARIAATKAAADRQADLDAVKAQFADVASARQQTVDLAKTGSLTSWGAPVISILVIGMFGFGYWQAFHTLSADINPVQIGLVEALKAAALAVVGYWVGSSRGSDVKDATVHAAVSR